MPIVPPPVFPVMSTPPSTNDMENFDTRADTFLGELPAVFRPAVIGIGNSAYANALESQVQATAATGYAGIAGTARDQAQAFAQSAINAPGTSGTSITPFPPGAGLRYIDSQPGKAWAIGQSVIVASRANPTGARMYGVIADYNPATGTFAFHVPVGAFKTDGAWHDDWNISLTATREGMVRQGAGPYQQTDEISLGVGNDGKLRLSISGVDQGPVALVGTDILQAAPPGACIMYAGATPPAGWLKRNGAAVSRTTYAALFAAIGTIHGAGNGSTTFNLPDDRGLVDRGLDEGRGLDPGRVLGSYQDSQNLAHAHSGGTAPGGGHTPTGATDFTGSHAHPLSDPGHAHSVQYYYGAQGGPGLPSSGESVASMVNSTATSTTGITMSAAGGHAHVLAINAVPDHTHAIYAEGGSEARMRNSAKLPIIKY